MICSLISEVGLQHISNTVLLVNLEVCGFVMGPKHADMQEREFGG